MNLGSVRGDLRGSLIWTFSDTYHGQISVISLGKIKYHSVL